MTRLASPRPSGARRLAGRLAVSTTLSLTVLGGLLVVAAAPPSAVAPATPGAPLPAVPAAADSPVGWASVDGGTTGGAGGRTVTVRDAAAFDTYASSDEPHVIRVEGTVRLSGMHRVRSNTTILGVGRGATLEGGGLTVNGSGNVVIRNLTFRGSPDDAVNIEQSARNIWVDHNTFTDAHDGLVDIKRESDLVTVSWNHFHDHDKTALLGHSDDHTADRGRLRVTYHHNSFDGTRTRHPRVRFSGHTHVFNNSYRDVGEYGVASTMDAQVLVEGNHFEDVPTPTEVGYASSGPGDLVARANAFVRSGAPATRGQVADPPYAYRLDPADEVPSIVRAGAGAGRIDPEGGPAPAPAPSPAPVAGGGEGVEPPREAARASWRSLFERWFR